MANDSTVRILLGNGNGTFQLGTSFGAGAGPTRLAAADVNGDGRSDFVVTHTYTDSLTVMLATCIQPVRSP